jgi:transcriptional regulator with XRE-family HTH domain
MTGSELRRLRSEAGITQQELADCLGVTQATISIWENISGVSQGREAQVQECLRRLRAPNQPHEATEDIQDEADVFEGWERLLRYIREKHKLTLRRLSEISGINIATLWNMENGLVARPQRRTIDRLKDALVQLGELEAAEDFPGIDSYPQPENVGGSGIGDNQAGPQAGPVGSDGCAIGQAIDFNPHDETEYPEKPGVYVFYDRRNRPVYVGQSGNIARRIRNHHVKFWFRPPVVQTACCIEVQDQELRKQIERTIIQVLRVEVLLNDKNAFQDDNNDD